MFITLYSMYITLYCLYITLYSMYIILYYMYIALYSMYITMFCMYIPACIIVHIQMAYIILGMSCVPLGNKDSRFKHHSSTYLTVTADKWKYFTCK